MSTVLSTALRMPISLPEITTRTGRCGALTACTTALLSVDVASIAGSVFITLLDGRSERAGTLLRYHGLELRGSRRDLCFSLGGPYTARMFTWSLRIIPASAALAMVLCASVAHADDDPFFGTDKALHFAVAGAIAGSGYGITTALTADRWKALAIGGGAAVGAGALKEGLDAAGYGDPSWKDFAWDVIGAAAGLGVAWAIDVAVHGGKPPPLTATEAPRVGTGLLRIDF